MGQDTQGDRTLFIVPDQAELARQAIERRMRAAMTDVAEGIIDVWSQGPEAVADAWERMSEALKDS